MSNIDTINVGGVDFGIGGTPGVFYDSYEEAEADLANIEDNTLVYTPEPDSTIQDIIEGMTSLHLVGTQRGAGSTNVTVITESSKRLLAITKKSGVIVETKEIPTSVLESGDVIPLGNTAPIIYSNKYGVPYGSKPFDTNAEGQKVGFSRRIASNQAIDTVYNASDGTGFGDVTKSYLVATDLSASTGASITYNGLNSFTITVTDSTLSVFLYTDMLVLGGSASGRNVSFDASGTSLSATDVEGAIKELLTDINTGQERLIGKYNGANLYSIRYVIPVTSLAQNTWKATGITIPVSYANVKNIKTSANIVATGTDVRIIDSHYISAAISSKNEIRIIHTMGSSITLTTGTEFYVEIEYVK